MYTRILGLDLAGSEKKQTGYCLIENSEIVDYGILFTDEQIKSYVKENKISLVAIDAPFNLPKKGNLRDCDILMKQIGLHPLPPTLPGMRILVGRVKKLLVWFKEQGIQTIEVFPAGAILFLGFSRKPKSIAERIKYLREIMKALGLQSRRVIGRLLPDEFDGIICAIVGYAYATNNYIEVKGKECKVIFPAELSKWNL